MPEPSQHLDLLQLDLVRAGEGSSADVAHVEACARCRAALQELQQLAGEVASLGRRSIEVPKALDRAVLAAARRELARARAPQVLRLRRWLGAAAALLVVSGLGLWLAVGSQLSRFARREPRDLDRNGRVDIVDAYALALRLQSGAALEPRWDFDGDGVVGDADVDDLARESVSLSRRRP